MEFISDDAHRITLEQAVQMTTSYRTQKESILVEAHRGKNLLPVSETFDRSAIDRLLLQPTCTAIRIYYGMDDALQLHAILVGVNDKNEDILTTAAGTPGEIVEVGKICPPYCAAASPLNP